MHRIECVPCGNRAFSNREALQQHLKTSSAFHPNCEKCDKRFSSESGLEAHMAAKHPPTFDCVRCARSYRHLFALEDHYRGSPYHPNCSRCGKGFKDEPELEEHRQTVHIQRPCTPCGGELVYQDQDSLERHYLSSDRHSRCRDCGKGFRDDGALRSHASAEHAPSTPSPPRTPSLEPSIAPSPPRPEIPSKDVLSNSPTAIMNHSYSHGLATTPSPKSGNPMKDYSSFGSRQLESPDLSRLSMSFGGASSPLLAIQPPPFSPAGLLPPGREANELWNSKMNVQVPSPSNVIRPYNVSVKTSPTLSRSRFSLAVESENSLARGTPSPPTNLGASSGTAPSVSNPSRFGFRSMLSRPTGSLPSLVTAPMGRRDSDSIQPSSLVQPNASAVVAQHPITRQFTSPPRMSSHAFVMHPKALSSSGAIRLSPTFPSPPLDLSNSGFAQNLASALPSNVLPPLEPLSRSGIDLSPSQGGSESYTLTLRNLLPDTDGRNTVLEDFDSETPKVPHSPNVDPVVVNVNEDDPEHMTLSSPSSFSFSSTEETHSISSALNEPLALEAIDPLIEDSPWPEAQLPLPMSAPDSPISAPNGTSKELPAAPEVSTLTHLAPDVLGSSGLRDGLRTPISLTNSPEATFFTPVVDTGLFDHDGQEKAPSSCLIAKPHYDGDDPRTPDDLSTPTEVKEPHPLHCRSCKADSCKDITATMCGHVFCNSCIVDAVIKTSKCPFCLAPTLLYCLFKLHL